MSSRRRSTTCTFSASKNDQRRCERRDLALRTIAPLHDPKRNLHRHGRRDELRAGIEIAGGLTLGVLVAHERVAVAASSATSQARSQRRPCWTLTATVR